MSSASSYDSLVQELYVAYFGRPADYFGLQNFDVALSAIGAPTESVGLVAAYSGNAAIKSLVDAFGTSAESANLYGSGSTADFINAIYENLFNRPAANAGLVFWSNAIDSHQVSKGLAALAILEGAMQNSTPQGVTDQTTIANKVAVAENFTTQLGQSSTAIVDYSGVNAADIARTMLTSVGAATDPASFNVQTPIDYIIGGIPLNTYTLTTSVETLVGGPGENVFNAVLDNAAGEAAGGQQLTLLAGDSITGGTLNNTLNIVDFGVGAMMAIPDGATIAGINTLNIASLEAVSEDFSGWQGLTSLYIETSTGDDSIVVGNQATVNLNDNEGDVTVHGGASVSVTTDSAHMAVIVATAGKFSATLGESTNVVVDTTIGASISISAGSGANSVTLGAGASGTITFNAHTVSDTVVLGQTGANSASAFVAISGLNNAGSDTITFSADLNTLVGFTQVTAGAVAASGGNAGLLASWIAAADGAAGSGIAGTAHTVTWFVYQGNTYLLESVAGQTADAGTMAAGNTLVELSGAGYSFTHAAGAGGTLHLLG